MCCREEQEEEVSYEEDQFEESLSPKREVKEEPKQEVIKEQDISRVEEEIVTNVD